MVLIWSQKHHGPSQPPTHKPITHFTQIFSISCMQTNITNELLLDGKPSWALVKVSLLKTLSLRSDRLPPHAQKIEDFNHVPYLNKCILFLEDCDNEEKLEICYPLLFINERQFYLGKGTNTDPSSKILDILIMSPYHNKTQVIEAQGRDSPANSIHYLFHI